MKPGTPRLCHANPLSKCSSKDILKIILDVFVNFINEIIAGSIAFVSQKTASFWENIMLLEISLWQILLDIFLVSIIFYYIFRLLKGTRTTHVLTGLVIIALTYLFSQALNLFALKWLLDKFLTFLIVAIPILFQQELRRGLEKLGQQSNIFNAQRRQEVDFLIHETVTACSKIQKMKKGALIVFRRKDLLKDYLDTGIILDAELSQELLVSIFSGKSPLHDGAVIIENWKIKAASCILPHTFRKYSAHFGTRHKAALGIAELTDALVIAISEEQGTISFAVNEKLTVVDEQQLEEMLQKHLINNNKSKK